MTCSADWRGERHSGGPVSYPALYDCPPKLQIWRDPDHRLSKPELKSSVISMRRQHSCTKTVWLGEGGGEAAAESVEAVGGGRRADYACARNVAQKTKENNTDRLIQALFDPDRTASYQLLTCDEG